MVNKRAASTESQLTISHVEVVLVHTAPSGADVRLVEVVIIMIIIIMIASIIVIISIFFAQMILLLLKLFNIMICELALK